MPGSKNNRIFGFENLRQGHASGRRLDRHNWPPGTLRVLLVQPRVPGQMGDPTRFPVGLQNISLFLLKENRRYLGRFLDSLNRTTGRSYANAAEEAEFGLRIIDYCANASDHTPELEFARALRRFRPHVLGLGCYTVNFGLTLEMTETVREVLGDEVLIVGGGYHLTAGPAPIIEEHGREAFDVILPGVGEETFTELCVALWSRHIAGKGEPKGAIRDTSFIRDITGIWVAENPPRYTGDRSRIMKYRDHPPISSALAHLISLPFYARTELDGKRVESFTLFTQRGCPWAPVTDGEVVKKQGCSYCGANIVFGRDVDYRTPSQVADEVASLYYGNWGYVPQNARIDFYVIDKTFTSSAKRIRRILESLRTRGFCGTPGTGLRMLLRRLKELPIHLRRVGDVRLWPAVIYNTIARPHISFLCMTRPDCIQADTVLALKEMGCGLTAIGVETGDEELARQPWVGRSRPTLEEIRYGTKLVRKEGIHCRWYLQVGMGGQTWASLEKSIRFYFNMDREQPLTLDEIRKNVAGPRRTSIPDSINVATNMPYPGTVLEKSYGHLVWVKPEYRYAYERVRHEPEIGFRDKIFDESITETNVMNSVEIRDARKILLNLHASVMSGRWKEAEEYIEQFNSRLSASRRDSSTQLERLAETRSPEPVPTV